MNGRQIRVARDAWAVVKTLAEYAESGRPFSIARSSVRDLADALPSEQMLQRHEMANAMAKSLADAKRGGGA